MEQQSLFNLPLGHALAENGIKQVELNANQLWLQEALKIVEMLSLKPFAFTSDDVWEWMSELHPDSDTHNHSAMGAVFRTAAKNKLCIPTGQYIKSKRPSAQSREIKVWRGRR